MKQIKKIKEPSDFVEHRVKPDATFDNIPTSVKDNLREALLKSQGYICCYCMGRIDHRSSKIEHFKSQKYNNGKDGSENLTLDYKNLFVACADSGGKYETQTCDSHKKELELKTIDLTSPLCDSMFKYDGNGGISSVSDDSDVEKDINDILNLNQQTLKDNRKVIYKKIQERFKVYQKKECFNMSFLNKELSHWSSKDNEGQYYEYCMVAVYLIKKYIGKLEKQQKK